MAVIVAKMRKERKIRIRKDLVREIIPLEKQTKCYCLVRDCSENDKGDFWQKEPLTYKDGFSIDYIYKYLDIEAFIKTLKKGFLFNQPSAWPDPYEKVFYNAKYTNIDNRYTPNPLYVCCFTTGEETDAGWKQYVSNSGLGARCVRIRLNSNRLISFLNNYAEKQHCNIYIGAVTYEYKEQEIDEFYRKGTKMNSFLFTKFSLNNYLSLLLVKRSAYYTEKELRIFVVPDNNDRKRRKEKLFIPLGLKWNDIIKEVLLSPDCTNEELTFIKWLCENNSIHCPVRKSTLKEKQSVIEVSQVEKDDSFISDIYDFV